MFLVTSFLKHVAYPSLSRLGYIQNWRTRQGDELTVLTYHGVFPEGYKPRSHFLDGNLVSKDCLREQLRILKCHYNVIAPEDFRLYLQGKFSLPPRAMLLTCDDGLLNVVTDMLPVLQDAGLKCLFFLTGPSFTNGSAATDDSVMLWHEVLWLMLAAIGPGRLNFQYAGVCVEEITTREKDRHGLWWELVKELSKIDAEARKRFIDELRDASGLMETWLVKLLSNEADRKRFTLLSRSQVNDLIKAGMTIGAHTLNHPVLSQCSVGLAEREVTVSEIDGKELWAFAYPFGTEETVLRRELALIEAAGYECAFMNVGAGFSSAMNKFAIPRIHITADMNLGEFEAHATGFPQSFQNQLSRSSLPLNQPALQQR